jgi:hypothetical protein
MKAYPSPKCSDKCLDNVSKAWANRAIELLTWIALWKSNRTTLFIVLESLIHNRFVQSYSIVLESLIHNGFVICQLHFHTHHSNKYTCQYKPTKSIGKSLLYSRFNKASGHVFSLTNFPLWFCTFTQSMYNYTKPHRVSSL